MECFVLEMRLSSIFVAAWCGENRMFYISLRNICISKLPMFWYHYSVWSGQVCWDYLINKSLGLQNLMSGIPDLSLVFSAGCDVHLHHNSLTRKPQTNRLIRIPVARANLVEDRVGRHSLNSRKNHCFLQNSLGIAKPAESMRRNLIELLLGFYSA